MNRAEMYREAARICADNAYAQSCIEVACLFEGYDEPNAYRNLFAPENPRPYWLTRGNDSIWGDGYNVPEKEAQGLRVLMLCLMAAMVEAGDA